MYVLYVPPPKSRLGPGDVVTKTTTSAITIMSFKLLCHLSVGRHAADSPVTDMQSVSFTNTIQEHKSSRVYGDWCFTKGGGKRGTDTVLQGYTYFHYI